MAERSSALDSSSGVFRMWVRIPAWPVAALVFLSKTLNHNCFVLRMGRKAVGPVCCVMHVKEPRTLIVKEKGFAPVFLEWQQNAPKSNSRVRFDPEKSPRGARPILGSDLPGIQVRLTRNPSQTDPESESEIHFGLRFR